MNPRTRATLAWVHAPTQRAATEAVIDAVKTGAYETVNPIRKWNDYQVRAARELATDLFALPPREGETDAMDDAIDAMAVEER